VLQSVTRYRDLSANAQLVLAVLRANAAGPYCDLSRNELLELLDGDWYPRKLDRALKELYRRGLVVRVTEGDAQTFRLEEEGSQRVKSHKTKIRIVEPPELYDLVAHYVRLRLRGEQIEPTLWRRMQGQAKRALKEYSLEELKACIDYLNQADWWKDKNWSLSAVTASGMVAFKRHKQKRKAAPGVITVQPSGEIHWGEGSLMRPEYDKGC